MFLYDSCLVIEREELNIGPCKGNVLAKGDEARTTTQNNKLREGQRAGLDVFNTGIFKKQSILEYKSKNIEENLICCKLRSHQATLNSFIN